MSNLCEVTYWDLLYLLLHSVDCGGRCGESLDGLPGGGQHALVLNGHGLKLRGCHDALHLRLEHWERTTTWTVVSYSQSNNILQPYKQLLGLLHHTGPAQRHMAYWVSTGVEPGTGYYFYLNV